MLGVLCLKVDVVVGRGHDLASRIELGSWRLLQWQLTHETGWLIILQRRFTLSRIAVEVVERGVSFHDWMVVWLLVRVVVFILMLLLANKCDVVHECDRLGSRCRLTTS